MIIYNNKVFKNRKELKQLLGGTNNYNKVLKRGDIKFINNLNIAINDERRIKEHF